MQRKGEVVFHAVIAVGGPGRSFVKSLEFSCLHLSGAEIAALQAADRPRDRRFVDVQGVGAWISQASRPGAADLNATHPRVDHPTLAASWRGLMFFWAEC